MIGDPEIAGSSTCAQMDELAMLEKCKLIVVEGNIGVGKSTLARGLAAQLQYKLFLEPTAENPFLEKFYADPKKYALKLQLWILNQRYLTYVAAVQHILSTGTGAVLDRSVFSDCVFANVCKSEGYISEDGYKEYKFWRQKALENLPLPHLTIFLNASPQCCHKRIHTRGRGCESSVPLDYLQRLHDEYSRFVEDMELSGTLVLRYDWSDFKSSKEVCSAIESTNTLWSTSCKNFLLPDPLSIPSNEDVLLQVLNG